MQWLLWFDETEGKRGLTLGVMTVFVRMFYCKAPSEVYSIICAQEVQLLLSHVGVVVEPLLQTVTPDQD